MKVPTLWPAFPSATGPVGGQLEGKVVVVLAAGSSDTTSSVTEEPPWLREAAASKGRTLWEVFHSLSAPLDVTAPWVFPVWLVPLLMVGCVVGG